MTPSGLWNDSLSPTPNSLATAAGPSSTTALRLVEEDPPEPPAPRKANPAKSRRKKKDEEAEVEKPKKAKKAKVHKLEWQLRQPKVLEPGDEDDSLRPAVVQAMAKIESDNTLVLFIEGEHAGTMLFEESGQHLRIHSDGIQSVSVRTEPGGKREPPKPRFFAGRPHQTPGDRRAKKPGRRSLARPALFLMSPASGGSTNDS